MPRPASSVIETANIRPLRELDDVIALGLGLGSVHGERRDVQGPLTKRELEVAALIEAGLSNRRGCRASGRSSHAVSAATSAGRLQALWSLSKRVRGS